jgi:RNA polymerase sigma-70 factor (ECF subfamily)
VEIAHQKAVDRLRPMGAKPRTSETLEADNAPLNGASATEPASQRSQQQRIRQALETLPAEARETLEITYFDGLTVAQAAEAMQAPVDVVANRLRSALAELAKGLGTR